MNKYRDGSLLWGFLWLNARGTIILNIVLEPCIVCRYKAPKNEKSRDQSDHS